MYVISKNFVEQFWRRRFLKVLQTGSKFLAFFNFQSSANMLVAEAGGGFREEVENMKIWFLSHNFMTNVEGATSI